MLVTNERGQNARCLRFARRGAAPAQRSAIYYLKGAFWHFFRRRNGFILSPVTSVRKPRTLCYDHMIYRAGPRPQLRERARTSAVPIERKGGCFLLTPVTPARSDGVYLPERKRDWRSHSQETRLNSKVYGEGGGGGARRRSTSALESGVGSGMTPVALGLGLGLGLGSGSGLGLAAA